jgi:hypothetical protein
MSPREWMKSGGVPVKIFPIMRGLGRLETDAVKEQ